jgi:hypothetical protein
LAASQNIFAFGAKDGWAASDAELITITRYLRGLVSSTGAKEASFASAATSCTPKAGAATFTMGANYPCITADGIQVAASGTTLSYAPGATAGPQCYSMTVGAGITDGTNGLFGRDGLTGNNILALQLASSALTFKASNSSGTVVTDTVAGSVATSKTVIVCHDNAGGTKMTVAGDTQTLSRSGAWSGSQNAVPSTIYLGRDASGGNLLGGGIKKFVECNGYTPGQCL